MRGDRGELLLDLGDVAVAAEAVRLHALVDLAEHEVGLRLAAGAGDAALGVDDEVADQAGPCQRGQREDRGGRVAARASRRWRRRRVDQRLELGAMQLGQAVDRPLEEVRAGVLEAIPARVVGRVAQPEVGSEVDDGRARWRPGPGRAPAAVPWGRARKTASTAGRAASTTSPVVARWGWMPPSGSASRSRPWRPTSVDVRVAGQEPDELGADVAGRADDPDADPSRPTVRVHAADRTWLEP